MTIAVGCSWKPQACLQKLPKIAHWHCHAGDNNIKHTGFPSTDDMTVQETLPYPMIVGTANIGELNGQEATHYKGGGQDPAASILEL